MMARCCYQQDHKMLGLGYQEARAQRKSYGYTASNMESKGNEEYLLYFGRAHMTDFETGVAARGLLKVGRGKWKTALMRGRNQPGVDFRIYAEILLNSNDDTHTVEGIVKKHFKDKNIKGSQGQKELYDIKSNEELFDFVYTVLEIAQDCYNITPETVNFYLEEN